MSKKVSNSTSAAAPSPLKGNTKNGTTDFLVVGIGASAGGLETFKEFFDVMPDAPGMAFVLVQHLDPTHKSMLSDLLKPHTSLKVKEVDDGTAVEPNHIYIIPPNKDMAIFNGILHLMDPHEARGFRKPIDFFLRSLAADLKERAVGIIFSGTGTEGTLSLKAIKGAGGLTLVQDPDTAKYDGMPRSAVAAGAADFVLPVKEMPERLIQYASNRKHKAEDAPALKSQEPNLLEKVFILLRYESGCNFNDYKTSTVIRRIEKRMAINQIERLEDYVKLLQKHPEETVKLFKELLIGVTNFFRDKESFEALESKAFPHIIQQKKEGDTIRVWVPGCSTGEEAYSIAMALNDALRKQKKNLHVQIFASDIDADAISSARLGIYPETIVADVSPERLRQYFYAESHVFRIKKEIRDQIIFAEQNILKDPPFSKLDLASCRNLLIYLNPKAQSRVFSILQYALNPNGVLFLGNSESLGEFADMFTTLDQKNKLFVRKNVLLEKKPEPGFRVQDVPSQHQTRVSSAQIKMQKENLATITEKLLLVKYAPACVIVDAKGDAVYFSGNTGKYLQPSPGEARWGLLDMAREGLKADLRTAIVKVRKTRTQEIRKNLKVKTNGHFQVIDLIVRPLSQFEPEEDFLMITFEDREPVEETPVKGKKLPAVELSEINALEQELASTKEYLRSTIEALEISNEELKSTNEELQSANEELQSTNEELETSKEELQSVNEEMVTVNSELQGKIDELAQTNNDMNNLLASTDIGTVFLDSNLNIKRFTPSVTNVINLIATDVGRPVTHLASNLLYDDLKQDVQKVLDNLVPVRAPVQTRDGIWYQMSIRPYRTSDNVIDGVVLTFVDITELKLMESKLEFSNEHLNLIMKSLPAVPYVCRMSDEFDPIYVGDSVVDVLGFNADMFTQQSGFWADRIHPDDKTAVFNLLIEVLKSGKGNQEFRWKCADGSYKRLVNYVRKVKSPNGREEHMVGIWQDIAAQWKSDEMRQM